MLAGTNPQIAGEIGNGAILGAPFLLATLALFVVGVSVLGFRKRREAGAEIRCREANVGTEFLWCKASAKDVIVDEKTIARDVGFFLIFFVVAVAGLPGVVRVLSVRTV